MGFLGFGSSRRERVQFNNEVRDCLRHNCLIETDSGKNPRFPGPLVFGQLLDEGWHTKSTSTESAAYIAIAYFMGNAQRDESDKAEAVRIYGPTAQLLESGRTLGKISPEKYNRYREVLTRYYRNHIDTRAAHHG